MATLDASAFAALSRFFQAEGKYASVFFLHNGPWPQPCYFCGEIITSSGPRVKGKTPIIHHIDGDHSNHDPANLAATHPGCHSAHHGKERKGLPSASGSDRQPTR